MFIFNFSFALVSASVSALFSSKMPLNYSSGFVKASVALKLKVALCLLLEIEASSLKTHGKFSHTPPDEASWLSLSMKTHLEL
jgi:hypothetical protein